MSGIIELIFLMTLSHFWRGEERWNHVECELICWPYERYDRTSKGVIVMAKVMNLGVHCSECIHYQGILRLCIAWLYRRE